MLYQEGWGVGRIKHSLTYSGGLSRSYLRTYAPARHFGFAGFSPFTRPNVIEVAEGIPFTTLSNMSVEKLYALKGEIVSRGVKAITGLDLPVFRQTPLSTRRGPRGASPPAHVREESETGNNIWRFTVEPPPCVDSIFPAHDRTAWITAQRPSRPTTLDPFKPHGFFWRRNWPVPDRL